MKYIWKIAFSQPGERFVRRFMTRSSNRKRFELRVMAAWFGAQTKTSFGTQSIISSTRTTSGRALFSTGRASVLAMTWVWFLNLDCGEAVETEAKYMIESRYKAYRSFRYKVVSLHCSSVDSLRFKIDIFSNI